MAFVVPTAVLTNASTTVTLLGYAAASNTWAGLNNKEQLEQRKRGLDAVSSFPYTVPIICGRSPVVVSSKVVIGDPGYVPSAG